MILVDGYRWCTGSLVNTTANDFRPLLLTADHCLEVLKDGGYIKWDAVTHNSPYLLDWTFYWHYESPQCTDVVEPAHITTTGARLVANNSITDFALLNLEGDQVLNDANSNPNR